MRRSELLQEIRKMRFKEAYQGWTTGRLTQADALAMPLLAVRIVQSSIHLASSSAGADSPLEAS